MVSHVILSFPGNLTDMLHPAGIFLSCDILIELLINPAPVQFRLEKLITDDVPCMDVNLVSTIPDAVDV